MRLCLVVLAIGAVSNAASVWARNSAGASAAPTAQPALPTATAGATHNKSATGSSLDRDTAMWERLRRVQKMIPPDARRARPFASVALDGAAAVPTATVKHADETGGAYRPIRIVYRMDGHELMTLSDEDGIARRNINVFSGRMTHGRHSLTVEMTLRGHGYGIFSYMKQYKATLQTAKTFFVDGTAPAHLLVKLKERPSRSLRNRFHIVVSRRTDKAAALAKRKSR